MVAPFDGRLNVLREGVFGRDRVHQCLEDLVEMLVEVFRRLLPGRPLLRLRENYPQEGGVGSREEALPRR